MGIDLMRKLLQFNPDRRLEAASALAHPFLAQFHSPSDEPVCSKQIDIGLDDNKRLKISDYRKSMMHMVKKTKTTQHDSKGDDNDYEEVDEEF